MNDVLAQIFYFPLTRPYSSHSSMDMESIIKPFLTSQGFCSLYTLFPDHDTALHITWSIMLTDDYSFRVRRIIDSRIMSAQSVPYCALISRSLRFCLDIRAQYGLEILHH